MCVSFGFTSVLADSFRSALVRKLIGTPSSLPALPDSPGRSFLNASRREVEIVLDLVKKKEEVAVKNAGEMLVNVRSVSHLPSRRTRVNSHLFSVPIEFEEHLVFDGGPGIVIRFLHHDSLEIGSSV
jgi:hypothetical protein